MYQANRYGLAFYSVATQGDTATFHVAQQPSLSTSYILTQYAQGLGLSLKFTLQGPEPVPPVSHPYS
jgi:hypothetical protein